MFFWKSIIKEILMCLLELVVKILVNCGENSRWNLTILNFDFSLTTFYCGLTFWSKFYEYEILSRKRYYYPIRIIVLYKQIAVAIWISCRKEPWDFVHDVFVPGLKNDIRKSQEYNEDSRPRDKTIRVNHFIRGLPQKDKPLVCLGQNHQQAYTASQNIHKARYYTSSWKWSNDKEQERFFSVSLFEWW